jgi:hypothetical protein
MFFDRSDRFGSSVKIFCKIFFFFEDIICNQQSLSISSISIYEGGMTEDNGRDRLIAMLPPPLWQVLHVNH